MRGWERATLGEREHGLCCYAASGGRSRAWCHPLWHDPSPFPLSKLGPVMFTARTCLGVWLSWSRVASALSVTGPSSAKLLLGFNWDTSSRGLCLGHVHNFAWSFAASVHLQAAQLLCRLKIRFENSYYLQAFNEMYDSLTFLFLFFFTALVIFLNIGWTVLLRT